MDIMTMLSGAINLPIILLGFVIGYIIKHIVDNDTVENKWIPLINTLVGIGVAVTMSITSEPITVMSIVMAIISGGVSGAASCGLYDVFQSFLDKGIIEH